jgi:hypothetical protein
VAYYKKKYLVKLPKEDERLKKTFWVNVGTVIINTEDGTGALYLNFLPFSYKLFLEDEHDPNGSFEKRRARKGEESPY